MGGDVSLRPMTRGDWEMVSRIYAEGIRTRNATFETEVPEWDAWDSAHLPDIRWVAELDGSAAGWAAVSPVSSRCVYSGVGEVSVYVAESARGRAVGKALLTRLVTSSEEAGIWTLQAGIFPENEASIALHLACGFRKVGSQERIGIMGGIWRDVDLFERRSTVTGV